MKISDKGLALVRAFEGCLKPAGMGMFKPYFCPAGVLTLGVGHTNSHGRQFNAGSLWTEAECLAELAADMELFEKAVDRLVTVPLAQHQFDALVSFAFNCGEGALGGSTLLRKLNAGDYEGASQEFHKWNKGGGKVLPGLVRRRASESLMFSGIVDDDFDGQPDQKPEREPMAQKVDEPTVAPMSESTIGKGAQATTGISILGIAYTIFEALGKVPGKILDAMLLSAKNPIFWGCVGIIAVAGYIWKQRSKMKEEKGV